jgi:hypothetical protein
MRVRVLMSLFAGILLAAAVRGGTFYRPLLAASPGRWHVTQFA